MFPTLPPGKTETGVWAGVVGATGEGLAEISLPIPLADFEEIGTKTEGDTECPGTLENPQANEGFFCFYIGAEENANVAGQPTPLGNSGYIMGLEGTSGGFVFGTFAITPKT